MTSADLTRYLRCDDGSFELIMLRNSTKDFPTHTHSSMHTFGLVVEGSISLTANGLTKEFSCGDSFHIPPRHPHSIQAESTYSLMTLCIRPDKTTGKYLNAMKKLAVRMSYQYGLEIDHDRIDQFFDFLHTFACSASDVRQNRRIQAVHDLLREFPEARMSVSQMANMASMGERHFIRSFKAAYGITPHRFQLQSRIRKAQRILIRPATIAEVASATGFCDQSHFDKQFQSFFSMTPSDYVSSYRSIALDDANKVLG